MSIRGKGINYDTGFSPAGQNSRPNFDSAQVKNEIQVIASELHCTAIRVSGADPDRIAAAGEFAAAAGLEVWFAPFPCELAPDATREVEDYAVELSDVTALELTIVPDTSRGPARASLLALRLA